MNARALHSDRCSQQCCETAQTATALRVASAPGMEVAWRRGGKGRTSNSGLFQRRGGRGVTVSSSQVRLRFLCRETWPTNLSVGRGRRVVIFSVYGTLLAYLLIGPANYVPA